MRLCLQIVLFLYYNFAQELIEDLRVPTLTNYPQPAQLEESLLRHLAGVVIHGNVLLQTLKTLPLQFCIISGSQTLSRVASITSCTQGIEQVLLNIMLFKCKLILTYVILQFLINVQRE